MHKVRVTYQGGDFNQGFEGDIDILMARHGFRIESKKKNCVTGERSLEYGDQKKDLPEWVSVKDRLPPMYGTYLVLVPGSQMLVVTFWMAEKPEGNYWEWRDKKITGVTHWMPCHMNLGRG